MNTEGKEKEEDKKEFGWEEVSADNVDFFGTGGVEESDEVKEPEEDAVEKTEEEVAAEKIEKEVFSELEDGVEDLTSNTPENNTGDDNTDTPSKVDDVILVNSLKERGILDFELEEGVEMTPELAAEIMEDNYADKVEAQVESMLEGMTDEQKNLNRYLLNGGTISGYLDSVSKVAKAGVSKGMDMQEEANQEAMVRNKLKQDGFDDEYIKSEIEHLKDSDRLETTAGVYYKKWETGYDNEQKQIVAKQKADKQASIEARRAQRQSVASYIQETDDVNGMKITKADKKALPDYMTTKIKLESGQEMTQMHNDLYSALNDPQKSVLLAKLLKTGFDFKSIKENAISKKTGDLKKKLRRTKTETPSSTTGTGSQKLTLAERLSQ